MISAVCRDGARIRHLGDYIGSMFCVTRPAWLGVVCNRFNCRGSESGAFYEDLKEDRDQLICETIIHRDVRVEQSAERRETVFDSRSSDISPAAGSFVQLADELLSRMEVIGNARQILKAMQPTYY
jgi:cellulose biosynthesis protein BcsQ